MSTDRAAIAKLPAPAATLADVLREVRALVIEVGELRREIAPELAARKRLLVALQAQFGSEAFTATDALERAAACPDDEIARALVPLLGGAVGGLRRLSRRLAKLAGKPAGGMTLTRIGDDRGSALYVIQTGQ